MRRAEGPRHNAIPLYPAQCILSTFRLLLLVPAVRQSNLWAAITHMLVVQNDTTCPAATQPVVVTGGGEDKGRFQTALLTLGATHTHFGHVKEALTALNETVRHALDTHIANQYLSLASICASATRCLLSTSCGSASTV